MEGSFTISDTWLRTYGQGIVREYRIGNDVPIWIVEDGFVKYTNLNNNKVTYHKRSILAGLTRQPMSNLPYEW